MRRAHFVVHMFILSYGLVAATLAFCRLFTAALFSRRSRLSGERSGRQGNRSGEPDNELLHVIFPCVNLVETENQRQGLLRGGGIGTLADALHIALAGTYVGSICGTGT